MEDFARAVREARVARGWSQEDLAKAVGIAQSTIDRIESGATRRSRAMPELAAALGIPLPAVRLVPPVSTETEFKDAPEAPPVHSATFPRDIPIRGICVGGEDADFTVNGETGDYARRPPGLAGKRNVYALHVVGESMYPAHREGALIYVDPSRRPSVGEDAIVELHPEDPELGDPGRGFIKRLKRRAGSKMIFEQFNPPIELEFETASIKNMHRVIPWEEVIGY
ncbi:helix-turn-helix transcriptional regulator [uncultured Methylobacterium sp.]|jgi:phage repressor protein C with HTH and peptisase S24 domain|uniref:helix-turn-helix domain-containing protein n=1 Tax=uncultured Methylobacterium sp. TaxID=157278 RepID=UPI00262151AD|nr:helix-turn-helix transcriptional regulator [uncultured Methylobacterium sp.]